MPPLRRCGKRSLFIGLGGMVRQAALATTTEHGVPGLLICEVTLPALTPPDGGATLLEQLQHFPNRKRDYTGDYTNNDSHIHAFTDSHATRRSAAFSENYGFGLVKIDRGIDHYGTHATRHYPK
jgi:hypothetical protein